MKKRFAFVLMVAAAMAGCQKKAVNVFEPYAQTDLRLPSVPLVVNDPYFSVWSPFDRLTDGTTRHWTDDEKPLLGLLRVDGQTYRFMGKQQEYVLEAIAPMADEERWQGQVTREEQRDGWQAEQFDASAWRTEKAAWGSPNLDYVSSRWAREGSDIYIRREVDITNEQLQQDLYLRYSHDDVFELYINGTQVASTGETWVDGVVLHLTDSLKQLLHEGCNVLAAHCHNTTGGAYADFGLYRNIREATAEPLVAEQKSVDVLATNTYYTFVCGPVELDLVFTAPMLINDYDLISTPVNYISYRVRSTDSQKHSVQLMLGASPLMAVNKPSQATLTTLGSEEGVQFVRTGTIDQPILARKGDAICIDWGYFYMPAINGTVGMGQPVAVETAFAQSGTLPQADTTAISSFRPATMPTLAYVHDFGTVETAQSFALVGYDEVQDIEYMYKRYKGYWAHGGSVSIFKAFSRFASDYASIMQRCREFDQMIYDDAMQAGGQQYAEILSGSYRHVMAAHKLFEDEDGNLLWFSKENNSNGCVNTVDLTYPEAPLFLVYNPELQKAMMTSIFDYSLSERWTKPFAAHDLGTYPIANGQVYGGDMPLEEAGNMITLAAMLCKLDGNTQYVDKYWQLLTTWADYLVENGQDPENQLCTDDFAGHWAHNCNLSLKAICGVAGYAEMARMKGLTEEADRYLQTARQMAQKWEQMALEGDHYRLAFDREGTWSQKYNMIWDLLWDLHLFSDEVYSREIAYYLTVQNKYGLPLDCRRDYTKSDWIMWTAAMAPDTETFQRFVTPVYDYIHETESRVPISDWSDTKTGRMVGFKARSVIGGYWMKVLADKLRK